MGKTTRWMLYGGGVAAAGAFLFWYYEQSKHDCNSCQALVRGHLPVRTTAELPRLSTAVGAYGRPCRACVEVALANAAPSATILAQAASDRSLPERVRGQAATELLALPGNLAILARRGGLPTPQLPRSA